MDRTIKCNKGCTKPSFTFSGDKFSIVNAAFGEQNSPHQLLKFSNPLMNKGLMRLLLSIILLNASGSKVGEGKVNASKPGKKLKMLSATF